MRNRTVMNLHALILVVVALLASSLISCADKEQENGRSELNGVSIPALSTDDEAAAMRFYAMRCSNCHGKDLNGGMGKSLVDGIWMYGSSVSAIRTNIQRGIKNAGMPEFGSVLDENELNRLVTFIRRAEAKENGRLK